MIETQSIVERGWWTSLAAPEAAPADREARIARVQEALDCLAPVFRPLALEVQLGWRELDTGLPSVAFPDGPLHLLVLEGARDRVTLRPTVAEPPAPRPVAALDGAAVAACLGGVEPPAPGLLPDWMEIRSVAAAVRAAAPLDGLRLPELGRVLPPYEPGWFAGPVGERGFEVWPPAALRLGAEDRVRLRLVVYWSGWLRPGAAERSQVEAAVERLLGLGWAREERG